MYYFKVKESSQKYIIRYKSLLDFLRNIRDGEITMNRAKKPKKILNQI